MLMPSWLRNLILIVILLLILGWTVWPVASIMMAGAVASANGCQLDEGSIHPCVVNGIDRGEQLYSMGVMGWFMLVAIPTGLIALATYGAVLLIVWLVVRNRRKRSAG